MADIAIFAGISMRLLSLALAATFCTSALAHAASPARPPRLHDSAMAFVEFREANKDKPVSEQVAAFKATVAPAFPSFYSAERHKGYMTPAQYDELVAKAIEDFPAIRTEYVKKAQQFETELPGYIATFKAAFPDFQPPQDIYVLHSLGEMDGGMRTIDGKDTLIFGVDVMVKAHGNGRESAFFHHELFHTYHLPRLRACTGQGNWYYLWAEGLATYVSKALNPDASETEMLLTQPDGMATRTRAVLPQALAQLESVLAKDDGESYAGLFTSRGADAGLPKRRGYYLGYLVAREAGRTRSIQQLAALDCAAVKELVFSTVHRLREDAR